MAVLTYRDLEVWQKSMDLVIEYYGVTAEFPRNELYGLASQLQRAAVSVPANIAEGRNRQSTAEFVRFLSIASGSLAEVETHISLAERLSFLDQEQSRGLLERSAEIGRMLYGLQRSLRRRLKTP